MSYSVLIVGAGQLGSRYLQGLAKVTLPLEIYVVDVSAAALSSAEKRWREVDRPDTLHHVAYFTSLTEVPSKIDLVIVSTSSDVRINVVRDVAKNITVQYWILEKVLAQCAAELHEIELSIEHNGRAWVNTAMYLQPLYKSIRERSADNSPIDMCFEGLTGLACNAIHFIDFVSRWNKSMPISVDATGLLDNWRPAKREKFFEVYGQLQVYFADGSKLRLVSRPNDSNNRGLIKIRNDEWEIFESSGTAKSKSGQIIIEAGLFQSQLTGPLVESILQTGLCDLPTLSESVIQHRIFINELLNHWNRHMPVKTSKLPIT
jgi:hypothetical protein